MAQVSEFSLVLLATGATLGHISSSLLGAATVVGLITIFFSSYLILHSQQVFHWLRPILQKIFGTDPHDDLLHAPSHADVMLFGCHRLGGGIVDVLEKMRLSFTVIDHDPEKIRALAAAKVPHVFGSADDIIFLESLPLKNAKTIISTIPEVDVNLTLIGRVRELNTKAVVLCVANHQRQAEELYRAGATYVVVPPYLGRRYIIDLVRRYRLRPRGYQRERQTHQRELMYLRETRQ